MLWHMFGPHFPATGLYVDVGAHHPVRFSNTKIFYDHGWRGVNIDPLPGSMDLFRRERPEDVNLEVGVAAERGELTYHLFDEPALNGFDPALSAERDETTDFTLLETRSVPVVPLRDLLDEHVGPERQIDFLSVDVEGLDAEVLKSNDWSRYRPRIVVAEVAEKWLEEVESSEVVRLMRSFGYAATTRTAKNCFFQEQERSGV
ncbi:FkbM family methyltransferase [Alienimonas sp. DA493]|uniref:FkbM family methyltransferase n=1 Tax=Alienimonas sp. DA493 TaxID=3373605 RepID=UPI00375409A5